MNLVTKSGSSKILKQVRKKLVFWVTIVGRHPCQNQRYFKSIPPCDGEGCGKDLMIFVNPKLICNKRVLLRKMVLADHILRTAIQFRTPQRGSEWSDSGLGGMLRKKFAEIILSRMAGKENKCGFLGDGIEIDAAGDEIELGKNSLCV